MKKSILSIKMKFMYLPGRSRGGVMSARANFGLAWYVTCSSLDLKVATGTSFRGLPGLQIGPLALL